MENLVSRETHLMFRLDKGIITDNELKELQALTRQTLKDNKIIIKTYNKVGK